MKNREFAFFTSRRYKIVHCFAVSTFFYLFLIFFLPFGVSNFDPNHEYTTDFLLEIFHFFGVTLLVALLNEIILKSRIIIRADLKVVLIWSIWTLVILGLANFFTYNILGNWHDFNLSSALLFVINCSSVFIFPIVGVFFYFRYASLKGEIRQMHTNPDANDEFEHLITFTGEGTRDKIALSLSSFLYCRSQDNYVAVYYVEKSSIKKQLLRGSLGKMLDSIEHPAIVRCHRSFVVNLHQVKAVKGGKKEIKLFLGHESIPVPVSRSFRAEVLDKLGEIKNLE